MHKKINSELEIAVLMLSYNADKYIEEAIKSFLNQKGIKNWKLYIADDLSADKSREIIKKYKDSYPEKVDYFFNEENLGISKNLFTNYLKIKSKYVVFASGDDIMDDQFFLSSSYNILKKDKSLSFTYANGHSFNEFDKSNVKTINCEPPAKNPFSFEEWVTNKFYINIHAIMFRTEKYPSKFENWVFESQTDDYLHRIFLLLVGKGFYQNKFSSLYRIRADGAQNLTDKNKVELYFKSLKTMKGLDKYARINFSIKAFNNFFGQYSAISMIYMSKKSYLKSIYYLALAFKERSNFLEKKYLLKTLLKSLFFNYIPKF